MRFVLAGTLATALALFGIASCTSSSDGDASSKDGSGGDACFPAPGSCDMPSPSFHAVDTARGCIDEAATTFNEVCTTSVNRCGGSSAVGFACAIAPDGGWYVSSWSDNDVWTANGWIFDQHYEEYATSSQFPVDQRASAEQETKCHELLCLPVCNSGAAFDTTDLCAKDAGGD